jgi:acetyl esterase/lipase
VSLIRRIALSSLNRGARHAYGPDPSQTADLHVPRGAGPFPVAVLIHGGFWQTRYGKLVMRPLAGDLVARGWAAWNLEYRRMGRGRGGGGGWPQTFDDVAAGIDALAGLDDPRLDLTRVAGIGHSAGGHLALWAGGRGQLPAGAPGANPALALTHVVALAPVASLRAVGGFAHALMGGTPEQVPDRYALADPMRRIPLRAPVLLVHPVDDGTVPVRQSQRYAERAREAGADVVLVAPPEGGHRAPIDPPSEAWRSAARWLHDVVAQDPSPEALA